MLLSHNPKHSSPAPFEADLARVGFFYALTLHITSPMSFVPLFTQHSRSWRENRYVYPVISRRSKGLSIGVNLNPDKACNFDCIYCCVDRTVAPTVRDVDLRLLREELEHLIQLAVTGEI